MISTHSRHFKRGFTLYELLAVMAIISVLTGLMATSLASVTSTSGLRTTVELIVRSAAAARQSAISSGSPVALVIGDTSDAGKKSILLLRGERQESGEIVWANVKPWENVPEAVDLSIFARNGADSFYDETQGVLEGGLPLPWQGQNISKYSYIVFRPDGTVDSPESAPSLSLKRLHKSDANEDYIILVQENSGRSKVIEP